MSVRQFKEELTINLDGRVMQLTEQEGKDLAVALNTHFARRNAAKLRRDHIVGN